MSAESAEAERDENGNVSVQGLIGELRHRTRRTGLQAKLASADSAIFAPLHENRM